MPPKRSAGRARRGPRPSIRRTNPQTLPAAEEDIDTGNCSSLNSTATVPSNAAASVVPSSTSTSGISDREVDRGDCTSSKKVAGLASTPENPPLDKESGYAQTMLEGAREPPSREDAPLSNDVDLAPSSTPEAPCTMDGNPSFVVAAGKLDFLSSSEANVGVEEDSPSKSNATVGGVEAVTVTGASDKDAAEGSGNGGKKKRVVKKTIKVVKKIIKRVPKGSIKAGHQDSKVEVVGSPEANDNMRDAGSAPSCSNSGEKEVHKLISSASCSPVHGNSCSIASPALNVDEAQQSVDSLGQIVKNKQDLNGAEGSIKKVNCEQNPEAVDEKSKGHTVRSNQNPTDAGSLPACLNPGEKKAENYEIGASCLLTAENQTAAEAEDTQNLMDSEAQLLMSKPSEEGLKEEIMEIDQKSPAVNEDLQAANIMNEKNMEIHDSKEKVIPVQFDRNRDGADGGVAKDENDASEALNEDECRKRGRTEVQVESNNAAKPEDVMGDGTHYSGEMEAMERRKRRKTEIFIGGIDKTAKEEDIRKVFGQVGELVDLRLPMSNAQGKNKGFAFLRYSSAVDAKMALEKFSNVEICGKQCSAAAVEGNDTIYVGNIDKNWKDVDVSKLLLGVGIEKIDTISVVKDPSNSGRNRGFAFVEFETCKDAEIALKKLQRKDIFGKDSKYRVSWAEQLSEVDEKELLKVKTVYAEFIPLTWDEAKLREKFKDFGEIDTVVLAKNLRTAKRKDFAFISYKSRESAIACIESLGHQPLSNDETKVNIKVSLALPNARGKQRKQVTSSSFKGTSKGEPKANPGKLNTKPSDPKRKGLLAVQRYGMHKPEHSSSFGKHRPEQPTIFGEQRREQASRWPPPRTGPLNIGHPSTHSTGALPVSTLGPGLAHSGLNRYPDFRLEASMHSSSREYMNGYPTYRLESSLPFSSGQYDGGYPHHRVEPRIATSSRYPLIPPAARPTSSLYSSRDMYASGVPYPARNYSTTEVEDEILRRSSLYRRY